MANQHYNTSLDMINAVNQTGLIYDFNVLWSNVIGAPTKFGNTTAEIQNAVNYTSLIHNTNTSWILLNQAYNISSEMIAAVNQSGLIYAFNIYWNNVLNHPTVFGNTSAEIALMMDNGTIIRVYNTSWILNNQGYNTSLDMINAVNQSGLDYVFNVYWNNVINHPTKFGNTSSEVALMMDNGTIIRNYNTSWILNNQAYNTSAEMIVAVNQSGLIYAFNVYWNNVINHPTKFGNTSLEVALMMDNGTIIRNYNTSWILNNQAYNTSLEMINAINQSGLAYAFNVYWGNVIGHPTKFGNTTLEIQNAVNYSALIKYNNVSWILNNQGYNTTAQMIAAVNQSGLTYDFNVLWANVVNAPIKFGNTTDEIRTAVNYSSTIRYDNTSWITTNQGYNTSAEMKTATNYTGVVKYFGNTANLAMGAYNVSLNTQNKYCLMANCSSYIWYNGTGVVIK